MPALATFPKRVALLASLLGSSLASADPLCGPGQVAVDADGHCCSPGQTWSADELACIGTPIRTACGPDQVVVDAAGHCCSVGQLWSPAAVTCIAPPAPPQAPPLQPVNLVPIPKRKDPHANRLAIEAAFDYAVLPSSISPIGLQAALTFFLNDAFGMELEGEYDLSGSVPPASAARWPLQQTAWNIDLDATQVLFSTVGTNPSGFGIDLYVAAGVGAISTRPIPEINPARVYPYSIAVDIIPALGARLFLTRSVSVSAELRDALYEGHTESQSDGSLEPLEGAAAPYGPNRLTNRFELVLRVGYWI